MTNSKSLNDLDDKFRLVADRVLLGCRAAGYELLVTSTLRDEIGRAHV